MSLTPGLRLGPYEIVAPLGAGGMGEVYRARDTRLGREVAVKVLPEEVAGDAERLQRFEQEARAASALNHPNILTLHDFGSEGERVFLVTELLEGESLRELLRRGPVAEKRAAEITAQVAQGLAAAHERGIVHRDLKPENLFLTRAGGVKILDFGLARMERPEDASADAMADATTLLETVAGSVLGTPGYMAPEQVRGERADARSDLFALGVVLHELLTGEAPFRRATAVESLSAILNDSAPDLATHGICSPPLARVAGRLLEKDRERRLHSAHDLVFALEDACGGHSEPKTVGKRSAARRSLLLVRIALPLLLLAAVAAAYWQGRRAVPRSTPATVRFEMPPPPATVFLANSVENVTQAVSPDGRELAFVGIGDTGSRVNGSRIWLRRFDEPAPVALAGTEGALSLAWSPDGRAIAFFARAKLLRIDPNESTPVPICEVPEGIGHAASWGADGKILFASVQGEAIYEVPASGGTPRKILEVDSSRQETRISWPRHLADGKGFFYIRRTLDKRLSLMLADDGRPPREVAPLASRVELVAPDWLLFVRDGALLAQRFDRRNAALVGSAVAVLPFVRSFFSSAWAGFAASSNGSIAALVGENTGRLAWFDRAGRQTGIVGQPGDYVWVAISPDGRSVLVDRTQREFGTYDLWSIDLERGVETRLTTGPEAEFRGVWLPDGRQIVYSALGSRAPNLVRRDLATGAEEPLLPSEAFQSATDVSPDGRLLAFLERRAGGRFHALTLPLTGERRPANLFPQEAAESDVRFSRDGRFVAYLSDLSGRSEAYVAPLASPGASVRVSPDGAETLRWSRDGREIVYLSLDNQLVSVPVRTDPELEIGKPVSLFRLAPDMIWSDFDLAPDGQRILATVRERSAGASPIAVVVGWRPPAAP